jgi:hypothetical protein
MKRVLPLLMIGFFAGAIAAEDVDLSDYADDLTDEQKAILGMTGPREDADRSTLRPLTEEEKKIQALLDSLTEEEKPPLEESPLLPEEEHEIRKLMDMMSDQEKKALGLPVSPSAPPPPAEKVPKPKPLPEPVRNVQPPEPVEPPSPAAVYGPAFEIHLARWKESHRKLRGLFEKIRVDKSAVASLIAEAERAGRNWADGVAAAYPAAYLFSLEPFDAVEPAFDEKKLTRNDRDLVERAIVQRVTLLDHLAPERCVTISTLTFQAALAPQGKILTRLCEGNGLNSRQPGILFDRELTADVEMIERVVDSPERFWREVNRDGRYERLAPAVRDAVELWFENLYNAGAAISSLGIAFGSHSFVNYAEPGWVGAWTPSSAAEHPRVLCIDAMPPPDQQSRLLRLAKEYRNQPPLNYWKENLELKKRICAGRVRRSCANTRSAKEGRVYSFQSVGCQIRDVTRIDVKAEMKLMDDRLRLRHARILESLDFCDDAERAGYEWAYARPTLSGRCAETRR